MKTRSTTSSAASIATPVPDFGGRPRRINLDLIVAVKGHGKLKIRPIRLDDEETMIRFHEGISEESIYMRYFEYLGLDRRTSHERLVRICTNTPNSYAIVVERPAGRHKPAAILAVGRLTQSPEKGVATFDTLISDKENEPRLAKVLLHRLVTLSRAFGFRSLRGERLVADHDTLNVCRTSGFVLQTLPEGGIVRVTLRL